MARRTKEELLVEIRRAYAASLALMECAYSLEISAEEIAEIFCDIPDIERIIQSCEDGEVKPSQMLGYAMQEVNGWLLHARTAKHPAEIARVQKVLALYNAKTGHDLLEQFADPTKMVKAVLRTGRILHESDYRIVVDILNDIGSSAYNTDQLAILENAADAFEATYEGET